jgi:hypothetical protein
MRAAVHVVPADGARDALALRLIDDPGEVIHVIPVDDVFEHREGADCPCVPVVSFAEPNGALVVHHAWDAREAFEE